MSIKTPAQLVEAFKKSGEFDRLRRELLTQFQSSDNMNTLMARVEGIVQKRLDEDEKLQTKAPDEVHRELLQELARYPLVERALADVPALSDPAFVGGIGDHARRILRHDRGEVVIDDAPRQVVVTPHGDASKDVRAGSAYTEVDGLKDTESMPSPPAIVPTVHPDSRNGTPLANHVPAAPSEPRQINGHHSLPPRPSGEQMDTAPG